MTISASNETQKKTDCYCLEIFSLQNSVSARSKKFLFREKNRISEKHFPLTIKNLTCEKLLENNVFFQIENSNRSKVVVLVAVAQDRCGRVVVVGVELKFVWQWLMKQNNSFTSHYFKKISRVCASIWSSLKLQIVRLIRCQIPPETRLHKTSSTQPLWLDLTMLGSKFCLTRWHLHSGQDLHRTN